MKPTHYSVLALVVSLALALAGCKSEPSATIQDLTVHLTEAGLAVAQPEAGPLDAQLKALETGLNQAAAQGAGRPELKTVRIDGVLTTIHRFESAADAKRFFDIAQKLPQAGRDLPARFKAALGTPRYVQHKNIVLRLSEKLGGTDNSAKTATIEQHLKSL